MGLPLDQWQFYVVTAAALAALYVLLRPFLRRGGASAGCTGCSTAPRRRRITSLTVDGRRR